MAKIYTMNIERKRLLKQRRERTLQNTKGKGPAEEYFLTALKASCKSYKASKNSHKRKRDNNGSINDDNKNIAMTVYDINNLEIVENHEVNATTNAENADTESVNIDTINTVETKIDKNDDIAKSDNIDDNPIMNDKESPLESPANDNIENDEVGENRTEEVPSPLIYGRKTDDPTKVNSSKRCRVIEDFIIIHIEISLKVTTAVNLEAEAVAEAEAITTVMVTVGPIIEAMLIINIVSIMVMMMSTRQINTVHHVLYVMAIIILPNIVLKGSMTSTILWKR